jgi:hypothetical protein
MWLATLGYLVVVEQVGHSVKMRSAPARTSSGSRASFLRAVTDFGDPALTDQDRHTLYDVRCALAHKYGWLVTINASPLRTAVQ